MRFSGAAHAVGLGHVAQGLSDARQRVRDSHKAMLRATGMEDIAKAGAEDMNITITGDIHQETPATPPELIKKLARPILPWIVATALGAGGIGAATTALLGSWNNPPAVESKEIKEGFLIELLPSQKKE